MIPKHVKISKAQQASLDWITSDGKPESEHIRIALDDYIAKKKAEQTQSATTSPSKRLKEGEENGPAKSVPSLSQ